MTTSWLTGASDQDLVDLYAFHAPHCVDEPGARSGTDHVEHAAAAAHTLEMRGYIEQAGVWTHREKPHLYASG